MGDRLTSHVTNGAACVVKKARFFVVAERRDREKKGGLATRKKPFYRGYPVTLQLRYLLPMALLSRYFSELPVWWDVRSLEGKIFGGVEVTQFLKASI